MLYPQNGDRVVTVDPVTSPRRLYMEARCWKSNPLRSVVAATGAGISSRRVPASGRYLVRVGRVPLMIYELVAGTSGQRGRCCAAPMSSTLALSPSLGSGAFRILPL